MKTLTKVMQKYLFWMSSGLRKFFLALYW